MAIYNFDFSATVRYVTNLTVDGSYNFDPDRTGSYNSTSNGRLSYGQSSLTSYRRSLSSSLNSNRHRPSSSLSHKVKVEPKPNHPNPSRFL